jgi:uncharacterized membrane protein
MKLGLSTDIVNRGPMPPKLSLLVALPALLAWTVLTFFVGVPSGWVHVLLAAGVLLLVHWLALRDEPAG